MNLGDIYIKTFFAITGTSIAIVVVAALLLRFIRRTHTGWVALLVIVGGFGLACVANNTWHRPVFVRWQQAKNEWVPQTGCLTYDPGFGHLFATYAMSETQFRDWVANYSVPMGPYDNSLLHFDSERLGFTEPELSFATSSAFNGKQLRVYYANGVMYLSYNVM